VYARIGYILELAFISFQVYHLYEIGIEQFLWKNIYTTSFVVYRSFCDKVYTTSFVTEYVRQPLAYTTFYVMEYIPYFCYGVYTTFSTVEYIAFFNSRALYSIICNEVYTYHIF
jgi:hypothetical protein